jgi:uncharacterized protein YbjT (DUF2867 family)
MASNQMMRVLVLGATGAQGGSVARHLFGSRRFHVRVLTRTPESAAAERLRTAGAEIVHGDFEDRASLRAALRGCRAVFGSTCCLAPVAREIANGRNLINAVAGAEIDHFVFSTTHAELEMYARSLELPLTLVRVPCGDGAAVERLGAALPAMLDAPGSFIDRVIDLASCSA